MSMYGNDSGDRFRETGNVTPLSTGAIIGIGGGIVILLITLFTFVAASERVNAGEACVVRTNGKISGTAHPGREWMTPIVDSLECYPTRQQTLEFTGTESDANFHDSVISAKSADGVSMDVAAILYFELPADNLETLYDAYGRTVDELVEKHIQVAARDQTRFVVNNTEASVIYLDGGMDAASTQIQQALTPELEEKGIVLTSFRLTAIDPSDDFKQAVEQQQQQEQQAILEEQKVAVAEQQAEQQRVTARGSADAEVIRAEGVAESNAIVAESITPEILQMEYYKTLGTVSWAVFSPEDVQPTLPIATPEPREGS